MLIGIDVGGTYTDGVLFTDGAVLKTVKKPTGNHLQDTLLMVLDELIKGQDVSKIERIVISTTLVTNLLATGQGERTALMLIPGKGLPLCAYADICPDTYFIKGAIDFRGHEVIPLDNDEIVEALDDIERKGIKKLAVAGKFSNRNDILEKEVRRLAAAKYPQLEVVIGSETAGKLNFPRRAVTTYYTAMTKLKWNSFVQELKAALAQRNLEAEVVVLKADGGTMPLPLSLANPCETVFSGPAASTMGAVALTMDHKNSVAIDIGGTTSDISLIIAGNPLYASKGANLLGHFTHINSFAVRSLALGGDSAIKWFEGRLKIGPERQGNAACFGGPAATVTDAFNFKYQLNIGDKHLSEEKLRYTATTAEMDINELCRLVVDKVISELKGLIVNMFREWEQEPEYRVWEVVNRKQFKLDQIIGIGAAAGTIIPELARAMQLDYFIHPYAPVANALGACIARPTLAFNLHVDTQNRSFFVDCDGIAGDIENPRDFQMQDAHELALRYLHKLAAQRGLLNYVDEAKFYREEQFNVIRGYDRVGKIFELAVQIAPGFVDSFKGVKI